MGKQRDKTLKGASRACRFFPSFISQTRASWNNDIFSPYPYLYELPKNYHKCNTTAWMNRTDLRGSVFLSFRTMSIHGDDSSHNGKLCEKYCCHEPRCRAWTLRFQKADTANCPKGNDTGCYCHWGRGGGAVIVTAGGGGAVIVTGRGGGKCF